MNKELDSEVEDLFPSDEEIQELKKPTVIEVSKESLPVIIPEVVSSPVVVVDKSPEELADEDFKFARNKILDTLEATKEVFDTAESFAKGTMDPEVINSFSGLIKSITDGSTKLLDLHSKLKSIKKTDEDRDSGGKTVNNTMIVTTAEMLQIIRKEINK